MAHVLVSRMLRAAAKATAGATLSSLGLEWRSGGAGATHGRMGACAAVGTGVAVRGADCAGTNTKQRELEGIVRGGPVFAEHGSETDDPSRTAV